MKNKTRSTGKRLEIEVKLKIANLRKVRDQIERLGFHELHHRKFEDNWILDFSRKPLFKKRCLLRLREFDGKFLLTFKAHPSKSALFKIREELETEVVDGATFYEILKRLGLVPSFRYQKYRTIFAKRKSREFRNVVISLDETPIGDYLEIEGSPKAIRALAVHLGYNHEDFITQSYLDLFTGNKPRHRDREMIFNK